MRAMRASEGGGVSRIWGVVVGTSAIALGAYTLSVPASTRSALIWAAPLVLIADGITKLMLWKEFKKLEVSDVWSLVGGIASVLLGMALAAFVGMRGNAGVVGACLISAWMLVAGCVRIARSFAMRNVTMVPGAQLLGLHWDLALVVGMAMVFLGIICVANPLVAVMTIRRQIGISLVAGGIGLMSATA